MADPKFTVGQRVAFTATLTLTRPLEGYVREVASGAAQPTYRIARDDAPQHQRWRWYREAMLVPAVGTAPVYRKCSDLPDLVFLAAIDRVVHERSDPGYVIASCASRWDIATVLAGRPDLAQTGDATQNWPSVPPRLLLAKAKRLCRRGLIEGCPCGCRGDFEVTAKGRDFQRAARETECDRGLARAFYGYARELVKVGFDVPSSFPGVEAARKDVLDTFGIPNTLRRDWAEIDRGSVRRVLPAAKPCREVAGTWIHQAVHSCPKWARG